MGAAEEIVAIVDETNSVVGSAPRREMRAKALPHRATYVLVFNARGHLYVQKRTLTKDVFPGYYDPAAGGGSCWRAKSTNRALSVRSKKRWASEAYPWRHFFGFITKTSTTGCGAWIAVRGKSAYRKETLRTDSGPSRHYARSRPESRLSSEPIISCRAAALSSAWAM